MHHFPNCLRGKLSTCLIVFSHSLLSSLSLKHLENFAYMMTGGGGISLNKNKIILA